MRCNVLYTITMMSALKWSSYYMTDTNNLHVVQASNLQERRTKKTTRRQRHKSSSSSSSVRNVQVLIWPDQTTVTSTNSSTSFPTFSPISTTTTSVTNVDPNLVDPKSCKSGKGRTCTPSTRPSVAPSESPSISHMPTISFQPSAEPSISHQPSVMPSPGPSPIPSSSPSHYPSPKPSDTPSQTPTISPPPTIVPSAAPSERPSPAPTAEPTISSQPTITPRPSIAPVIDPNGFIDRIVTDDDGQTGVASQCRRDIPSTASRITDQLIVYEYDITTKSGTDMTFVTDTIAAGIQKEMSKEFLICTFGEGTGATDTNDSFDTHTISSLPVDIATTSTSNCSSTDGTTAADCYRINSAFTATIFYNNVETRRQLQNGTTTTTTTTTTTNTTNTTTTVPTNVTNATTTTTPTTSTPSDTITDSMVAERFTSSLQSLFESGQITSGINSVLGTEFQGLVNDDSAPSTNDTTTDDSVPPEDDDGVSQSDRSSNGGKIAGSVIGTLIGLALIAAIIAFVIVRRRNNNDDDDDDDDRNNNATNGNNKNRTMDVTQEDFNDLDGGGALYSHDADDLYDDRDDRAMIDRSIIASDDGSYFPGYADTAGTKVHTSYIIDDDHETMYSREIHNTTEPSFTERIRSAEQPGPIFVKTNEVLYQMNRHQMDDNNDDDDDIVEIGSALERAAAASNGGRQQRDYNAPDTVHL